jgi:hypothetical protein
MRTKIELAINDIDVLREACVRLDFPFLEAGRRHIRIPGAATRIYVEQINDAEYELAALAESESENELLTRTKHLIQQAYAVERVKKEAKAKRMRVRELTTEAGVRLVLTAY